MVGRQARLAMRLAVRAPLTGVPFHPAPRPRTARSVVGGARHASEGLCGPRVPQVFGLVLYDRGSGFSDAERIEHRRNGVRRLSLFYCDPLRASRRRGPNSAEKLRIPAEGQDRLRRADHATWRRTQAREQLPAREDGLDGARGPRGARAAPTACSTHTASGGSTGSEPDAGPRSARRSRSEAAGPAE